MGGEEMVSNEYEDYSDTVLYDVFYEAGTMLGGWLVAAKREALARGNIAAVAEYEAEHIAMLDERDDVGAFDRVAQIAKIEQWHVRCAELDAQKVLVAS
ncbi:hypothetical protein [Mobiluncus mulieris]|uniref:hypothetical protein n=1 Tax=Mobiluncus mulieris TaxID=2052 RepID=UPI0021E1D1F8|nr:hypothetical protein [Mobiluncus mulieris]